MLSKIIRLINKANKSTNIINSIDTLIDTKIKTNYLLNSALTSVESITVPVKNNAIELIVSFTTYNKRIHDAHLIIESIAQQTVKPNRVVLWLDEEEFTLDSIPAVLKKQLARGLEIRFCPNYRSYKKLIPTLELFPKADIITIDDDLIYPYDFVEILMREALEFQDTILCFQAHKICFKTNGILQPYSQWDLNTKDMTPSKYIFPVGAGGIFYPCGTLSDNVTDKQLFTELAPSADDVWFKGMSLLQGVKCKKITDSREFYIRFLKLMDNQDIGLFNINVTNGGNDRQILDVFNKYNLLHEIRKN